MTFNFFRFIQSGLYVDFFLKKLIEVFIRNVFVYASQFLGEKFMIEYLTKKIIDSSIFNINRLGNFVDLVFSHFFIQLISVFFYFLTILNIFFIFL